MKKIIVVVDGGLVQAAYCRDQDVSIEVLDYDNFRDESCKGKEKELYEGLEKEVSDLTQIY